MKLFEIDEKALHGVLDNLGKFYTPENPQAKDGIGHEIEHLKGAIRRCGEITGVVNDSPEKYGVDTGIDNRVSTTVSALHDIGNVCSRENHNHFSRGIVQGYLLPENVVSVPDKDIQHRSEISSALENGTSIDGIVSNESYGASAARVCAICVQFEIQYTDYGVRFDSNSDLGEIAEFIQEIAPDIFREEISDKTANEIADAVMGLIDECGKGTVFSYVEGLQEITDGLADAYRDALPALFDTVAEAVQDHNIDFNDDGTPYFARSTYGAIAYDADKDNVEATFELRTLAFAINNWAVVKAEPSMCKLDENGNVIRDENGKPVPDVYKCAEHILDQARERFSPAGTEISTHAFEYKLGVVNGDTVKIKIPGVSRCDMDNASKVHVNGEERALSVDLIRNPDGTLDRHPVCVCGEQVRPEIDMKSVQTERIYFKSESVRGVDLRSQLDEIYERTNGKPSDTVLSLREKVIEIGETLGNPEWRETHKEEIKEKISEICERYEKSESHEAAVDIGEEEHYGIESNSWEEVIADVLGISEEEKPEGVSEEHAETLLEADETRDETTIDEVIDDCISDITEENTKDDEERDPVEPDGTDSVCDDDGDNGDDVDSEGKKNDYC